MATNPAVRRWTYEEFRRLPDDGNRYEVIAGELHVTPAPRYVHQRLAFRLGYQIERFLEDHGLGGSVTTSPVDVVFGEGDYLEPDVVFLRREHARTVGDVVEEAPDLVVEVTSPSTARRDRGIKRERYARFGVPEYWIVDMERRQIEVCRPSADPQVIRDLLRWQPYTDGPVLEIDVQELIRRVLSGS